MLGLEILYDLRGTFKDEAVLHAKKLIGTTSDEFAEEWLLHDHAEWHQSDMVNCGKPYRDGGVVLDSAIISSMRSSTDEERAEYERMRGKHAIDTGVNIFDLHDHRDSWTESAESVPQDSLSDTREKLEVDSRGRISSEKAVSNIRENMKAFGKVLNGEKHTDEPDSREKLEAEIRGKVAYSTSTLLYPPSANKVTEYLPSLSLDTVLGWLDRQSAITRLECMGGFDGFLEARVQERTAELQAQVDDLAKECANLQGEVYMLNAECDSLTDDFKACSREVELYRARLSDLLDAVQEAWRVGQYGLTIVDMEGDVIS